MRLLPQLLMLALLLPHLPTLRAVAAPSNEPVSRAAILDPDELPRHGQCSSAQSMMRICTAAGWQAEVITAQQLAEKA